ncbi:P-loop containing nucleoside triphosphate hydrolase protein [Teratosphaeria nubilosa]|uniref:P-loop containing nucleoside triphosphate hydrolase protein n=1 Tax=Teratosphaeria nubilosa TaxID=161662 RepID=A0A6G1LE73_9PEZI|nr:P-loop containing nucleoside triphosphate hydrolase protein [Teratosphaeria nubilosa]
MKEGTCKPGQQVNGQADEQHSNYDSDDSGDDDGERQNQAVEDDNEETVASDDRGNKIRGLYRKLLSRRVDLVGDYAGDELFLIEGDSLLLQCFSDPHLDFETGFQLLHATYNVEFFLHNLVKRKCNFHLVFFDSNRHLCVPPGTESQNASKYYFARAAIIRHLQVNLPVPKSGIEVRTFSSYGSDEFEKYNAATGPYFLMMNDGATAEKRKGKHVETEKPLAVTAEAIQLRTMILYFVARGYNIALVNGLEWRDSKIMTMVLETSRLREAAFDLAGDASPSGQRASGIDVAAELDKLSGKNLTERQALAVISLAQLLRESTSPEDQQMGALFLQHVALLTHLPLSARRLPVISNAENGQRYLTKIAAAAESILQSPAWRGNLSRAEAVCDVADAVDGRLFSYMQGSAIKLSPASTETFQALSEALTAVSGFKLAEVESVSPANGALAASIDDDTAAVELAVLPFSNPVFDEHLKPVHLRIDETIGGQESLASHRIFQELTHWHNAKKPIVQKAAPSAQSDKAEFWAKRRNQWFMAEMRTYAASLTNAVGKSLEPETIIVGTAKANAKEAPVVAGNAGSKKGGLSSPMDSDASDSGSSSTKKGAPKKAGGKTAQKNAGKQAMMNQIAAAKAKKEESAGDKVVASWHTVCKNIEADKDVRSRFKKAKDYLAATKSDVRAVVEAEVRLYLLTCALQYWAQVCKQGEKAQRIEVTALIWNLCSEVMISKGLTKTVADNVELAVKTLGLPIVPKAQDATLNERKLGFTFALADTKTDALSVGTPSTEFQLKYAGPYLERSFDSRPDSRVDFNPDGWQRKVLDGIDANESVFVVAPTSAGKTFISFYAMRKVLEADDESVLVYVAPTKALVNQIAAEIQARYSKNFKYGGKSVWAIHTRDYRINNPTGCQVLVTVPHVLQIMLLAPSNANSWSSRVKRIIFDEVHSIGQAEDGVVWEQLLLMSPCPIIALSATVGNPNEFSDWLTSTQKAIGIDLVTVQHPYRYSDLRKYFYVPPAAFAFRGVPEKRAFGTLGLESLAGFNFVHPVAALIDRSRGVPEDLGLEPRDCLDLYSAMNKHQKADFKVPSALAPGKILPPVARKADVLKWEKELKEILRKWIADHSSPYDAVVKELEGNFTNGEREKSYETQSGNDEPEQIEEKSDLEKTTLPLLCRLQEQDALPAIFFNYDRHQCEKICQAVLEQLQRAELTQRKSGLKWDKTLERWEEWKKVQAKNASKKAVKKTKPQDEEGGSKLDQQRDAADSSTSQWDSFDPDKPQDGYHFADYTKVQLSELELYVRQLGRRNIIPWLIQALERGIGVHHAGMNRKYRQVVEILFRKGFLRCVIATGTLALGINMPCKTVVFSGDSVFLTALNYRQCAGRAGRRGFDLLGNIVFQGVSRQKVCRLISSRLPDLNGHFPITTTLVLRLFTLLHESKNSKYAVGAINALLSQPRLYMGGPSFKDQTMHHLRFSVEYLRRQHLLGMSGAPLNFAGLVSHLYFTENSSFGFHALLKEGYFHELCANHTKNEKDTLQTLMLVFAHTFQRIPCKRSDLEYRQKVVRPSSSIVFLPPLPKKAANILRQHNQETLDVFRTYVETFAEQHLDAPDRKLPLSGIEAGGDGQDSMSGLKATKVRSPFVALSGPGDKFETIHDLCQTTRDGVFLEEAVIPHIDVYPDEMELPLNAWLLDFYKHGDINTIEKANGVRRADIWFLLNDFSLVLATIITSLLNFMKLREGTDMDMLDVMGDLDEHDNAEDNDVAAAEQESEVSGPASVADSAVSGLAERPKQVTTTKKKAKNADSWEDVADDEETSQRKEEWKAANAARLEAETQAALENGIGQNEGLKDVLKAFQKLHTEFNVKFRAMWA